MRIENLQNENRKYAKSIGNFHVLEYVQDASVSPMNAMNEYFMSKMNVRRRQVVIDIDKDHSAVIQAGSMQWMCIVKNKFVIVTISTKKQNINEVIRWKQHREFD